MMKLSKTQADILSMFDGLKSPRVEVEGSRHAAVKSLAALGFVTFRKTTVRNYPQTPGGMVWHQFQDSRRVVYLVCPTQAGKDFIYNGGLDQ